MLSKIIKYIRLWPEFLTIPGALLIWWLAPVFLRLLDPVSAPFDSGVLQIIIFSVVGVLVFSGVVFAIIRWNFKPFFGTYEHFLHEHWHSLTPYQRICVLVILYLGLLLSCCLLALAL